MDISAVVLTKNSEKTLKKCLESISWCKELIVIDDMSTDSTVSIAKAFTEKVYKHALAGDFSKQRNFGLEKATCEWVLFLDSDEVVSLGLFQEIHAISDSTPCVGIFMKRQDIIWGKKLIHGESGNVVLLRLAKKTGGLWQGEVHEVWKIRGKTMLLKNPIHHFPHPSVGEFLQEVNNYSTIRARQLHKEKKSVNWWDILFYPKGKFFINFVLKAGFLDGIPGFLAAGIMSFHSFLVRGKLWQLQNSHE